MTIATRSFEHIVLLASLSFLALSTGFLAGMLASVEDTPITLKPDTRPKVPTVQIHGVRNGLLHGRIIGNARVSIGDAIFVQSGAFALDAAPLLRNEVTVNIPAYARFAASVRGTKYYPINAAAARRIAPKNRIYFRSELEAENAGYSL